jgi:glycosyltransferase involved in cell wall biosynthesis
MGSTVSCVAGSSLFSVIVPTHGRPELLSAAIASVLGQTVVDFELLVVDDASDPPAVVPGDARARLLRVDRNRGPAAARNVGIAAATGEYLAFLDDDDLFMPSRLEVALEGLASAPIAICWSRFHDRPPGRHRVLTGDVRDSILDGPTPGLGATALRRELAPRFDERWHAVEDVDWWIRAAEVGHVATVPTVAHLFRRHDGLRHRNDLATRVQENLSFLADRSDYFTAHRRATAHRWKRIGLMARALGDGGLARTAFARSLRLSPRPATAKHLLRSLAPARQAPEGADDWRDTAQTSSRARS